MSYRAILIVAFLTAQFLDLTTTYIGFTLGLREGNPLPAALLAAFGGWSLAGLKVLAVAAVLILVVRLQKRYPKLWHGVLLACVLSTLMVVSNIVSIAVAAN